LKYKNTLRISVEEEDDDDTEFIVDKFGGGEDFILSKMRMRGTKMPRMRRMRGMRDMVICVRIIQLMTNSTRGIF
jgi:hypothetical protein